MTTDNSDPFKGRRHGDIVFRDIQNSTYLHRTIVPVAAERNGCGTIQIAIKPLRMLYAICRLVPGLTSKLNQPSRARRSRQMRCGLVASPTVRCRCRVRTSGSLTSRPRTPRR